MFCGLMLVNNRTLGAHWRAQSAPVTGIRIEPKTIVVEQPGLSRTHVYAGTATRLLHYGMNAELTVDLWDHKLAPRPLDNFI